MNEYRRVVVTGMGIVSPVGSNMETAWNHLISGYNGIGPITYFDTTNYKAKLGAQVQDFDPMQYMDRSETLRSDRFAQYACVLMRDAMGEGKLPVYTGLNNVKFRSPVKPGDTIETRCRIRRTKHPFYFAEGTVKVDGRLCVSAEFSFAITGV